MSKKSLQVYVKLEKINIMVMLCNERNCDQVLQEMKDYAQSPDMDFARKAIKCIGKLPVVESRRG